MNRRHLKARMTAALNKALADHAAKGLPRIYRESSCTAENQFIHLYPNGKKALIEQDRKNFVETVIREL